MKSGDYRQRSFPAGPGGTPEKIMAKPVVILSTSGPAQSEEIAGDLLEKRLCACVNILPVRSRYHWKGELCRDEEHLLVIKTTDARSDAVIRRLQEIHSYELPEAIVIPVTGGFEPYLQWVREETSL
jgi:periplasmic divalent cation tolerance protein